MFLWQASSNKVPKDLNETKFLVFCYVSTQNWSITCVQAISYACIIHGSVLSGLTNKQTKNPNLLMVIYKDWAENEWQKKSSLKWTLKIKMKKVCKLTVNCKKNCNWVILLKCTIIYHYQSKLKSQLKSN